METTEWKWKTKDGLEMCSKAWLPESKAKGVVCLVHGVGEHIGRYQWDAEALTAAGYILAGFDIRGFGNSEGPRGHLPALEDYFDDIDLFLGEVAKRWPDQERFLYGHSMGGVLVLAYTPVRHPVLSGVISTAPGLKTVLETQKFKVFLAKVLGKVVPTMTMDSGLDVQAICRDSQVVDAYVKDPLVHKKISTSWGREMLRAIELAYQNAPSFPLPLLLMHGTKDQIAYPSSSTSFAELAPKDKVTLKMWEGFRHELHTDHERSEVFKVMVDWLNEH